MDEFKRITIEVLMEIDKMPNRIEKLEDRCDKNQDGK
jgi:hypothetical protein